MNPKFLLLDEIVNSDEEDTDGNYYVSSFNKKSNQIKCLTFDFFYFVLRLKGCC